MEPGEQRVTFKAFSWINAKDHIQDFKRIRTLSIGRSRESKAVLIRVQEVPWDQTPPVPEYSIPTKSYSLDYESAKMLADALWSAAEDGSG